jgi:hypothetical protein
MPDATPEVIPTAVPDPNLDPLDPFTFIAGFKGAPSKEQIEAWKQGTCNHRIKMYSPDASGTRCFLLRGLSARELEACQSEIPANLPNQDKIDAALQAAAVAKAVLWTSTTATGKITPDDLRINGAGLQVALYELICQLSDYVTPVMLERLSVEL